MEFIPLSKDMFAEVHSTFVSRPVVPTFTYILIYCRCTWMIFCRCWLSGDHNCNCGDQPPPAFRRVAASMMRFPVYFASALYSLIYCTYIIMNNIIAASVHTSNKIVHHSHNNTCTCITSVEIMSVATSTKMLYSSCIYIYIYIYIWIQIYIRTHMSYLHSLHISILLKAEIQKKYPPRGMDSDINSEARYRDINNHGFSY